MDKMNKTNNFTSKKAAEKIGRQRQLANKTTKQEAPKVRQYVDCDDGGWC
ncbi:hypothetical protein SAMN05421743_11574 [Thalassobacillus cyri]|uniref:Uncharacterized protein n=1 Tax=Thalassobacillus cyri TaxID=571932 RepID=A0A1H4GFP6_9BACI|nr:hypothetical protein SAMN05421743_11574 [Thalassobacillus cyri]